MDPLDDMNPLKSLARWDSYWLTRQISSSIFPGTLPLANPACYTECLVTPTAWPQPKIKAFDMENMSTCIEIEKGKRFEFPSEKHSSIGGFEVYCHG